MWTKDLIVELIRSVQELPERIVGQLDRSPRHERPEGPAASGAGGKLGARPEEILRTLELTRREFHFRFNPELVKTGRLLKDLNKILEPLVRLGVSPVQTQVSTSQTAKQHAEAVRRLHETARAISTPWPPAREQRDKSPAPAPAIQNPVARHKEDLAKTAVAAVKYVEASKPVVPPAGRAGPALPAPPPPATAQPSPLPGPVGRSAAFARLYSGEPLTERDRLRLEEAGWSRERIEREQQRQQAARAAAQRAKVQQQTAAREAAASVPAAQPLSVETGRASSQQERAELQAPEQRGQRQEPVSPTTSQGGTRVPPSTAKAERPRGDFGQLIAGLTRLGDDAALGVSRPPPGTSKAWREFVGQLKAAGEPADPEAWLTAQKVALGDLVQRVTGKRPSVERLEQLPSVEQMRRFARPSEEQPRPSEPAPARRPETVPGPAPVPGPASTPVPRPAGTPASASEAAPVSVPRPIPVPRPRPVEQAPAPAGSSGRGGRPPDVTPPAPPEPTPEPPRRPDPVEEAHRRWQEERRRTRPEETVQPLADDDAERARPRPGRPADAATEPPEPTAARPERPASLDPELGDDFETTFRPRPRRRRRRQDADTEPGETPRVDPDWLIDFEDDGATSGSGAGRERRPDRPRRGGRTRRQRDDDTPWIFRRFSQFTNFDAFSTGYRRGMGPEARAAAAARSQAFRQAAFSVGEWVGAHRALVTFAGAVGVAAYALYKIPRVVYQLSDQQVRNLRQYAPYNFEIGSAYARHDFAEFGRKAHIASRIQHTTAELVDSDALLKNAAKEYVAAYHNVKNKIQKELSLATVKILDTFGAMPESINDRLNRQADPYESARDQYYASMTREQRLRWNQKEAQLRWAKTDPFGLGWKDAEREKLEKEMREEVFRWAGSAENPFSLEAALRDLAQMGAYGPIDPEF